MANTNAGIRRQLNLQQWLFTALLLLVITMLAWLSTQYHWQADWTANQRNSLSQSSIALLDTLQGEVQVRVYARDDAQLHAAVNEILQRYQRVKADFRYRIINPDLDFASAQSDNIERYGQVVIFYSGQREIISNLSEQAISSALLRLSRGSRKKLVFLSGHGERDPQQNDNRGYSQLQAQLQAKGFDFSRHNLLNGPLPEDTRVLVIAAPTTAILPGELEHIENYLDRGGNLLWLIEPGEADAWQTLLERLGIELLPGTVVDNNITLRKTLRIEHPAIIPVLEYYPHAITRGVDYNTLFPTARGVRLRSTASADWQGSVLWRSFERSWSETAALGEEIVFSSADGDIAGPVPLAVALERPLAGESAEAQKASQRVVVIGDSDFLGNAWLGAGANLLLATNLFNWLAGDDDLIAIDIKHAPDLQLQLDDFEVLLIGAGFLLVLPLALLGAGGWIWYRRRNR